MMIGWATPTVEPFFGTNDGGPKGAVAGERCRVLPVGRASRRREGR